MTALFAPHVRGPRDLPDMRQWLRDQWEPTGPFAMTAAMNSRRVVPGGLLDTANEVAAWQRDALTRSTLWWVTADMVDLIEHSAAELPAVAYGDELLPNEEPHMAVFERPLQGTDAAGGGDPVLVDAMVWTTSSLYPPNGGPRRPAVSMFLYRRVDLDAGMTSSEMVNPAAMAALGRAAEEVKARGGTGTVSLHGELWMPLGRTDWPVGSDWNEYVLPDLSPEQHASMTEDRRWLATMCALAQQPNVVELGDRWPGKPAAKRAKRAGFSNPTVQVVNLRRTVYEGAGASREPTDESGRRFHVRWPVTGHWRNQAYGPGRAYRRPVYIAPYIKGPEGAPLRSGAKVHVLKESSK